MSHGPRKTVRVEVSDQLLKRLLRAGQVCAADFRCLDGESKHCLWRLCLESCAANLNPCRENDLEQIACCRSCGGDPGSQDKRLQLQGFLKDHISSKKCLTDLFEPTIRADS